MERAFLTLKVSQLALDRHNPRLKDEATGEMTALAAIIKQFGSDILGLAKHVAEYGLSPLERMMVHPLEDGKYLADEGNRRTAVLKLLNDPSIAEAIDPSFHGKLKRIIANAKHIPDEIDCVTVQSDQERRVWLKLRHLGKSGGEGVSPWGTPEQTRFAARNPEDGTHRMEFGLRVTELVLARCKLTDGERDAIQKLPLTTLERMLGDPAVRKAIGIARSATDILLLTKEEDKVLAALKEVVLDVANGTVTSRNMHNVEARQKAVTQWPAKRKPGLHGEPIAPVPLRPDGPAVPTQPATPAPVIPAKVGRKAASPDQRSKLVPVSVNLNISDRKIHRVFVELKKLDVEGFENAVSVLLRVFLELSVDAYLDREKIPGHEHRKLRLKMEDVANHWEKNGKATDNELKPWRGSASTHVLFSLNTLHSYVHNRHGIPSRRELLQTWDKMEPYFKLLWP